MARKLVLLIALSLFFFGCACRQSATRVKVDVRCWYGTAHVEVEHHANRTVDQRAD